MIYVCSDLHGCYDKYIALLDALALKPDDTLYILGDVLDRGPQGIRLLLDAVERPNLQLLAGNHELSAALLLPWTLREVTAESTEDTGALMRWLEDIRAWQADGGDATLAEFRTLSPARRQVVLDELSDLPAYDEVTVSGTRFLLVHAGLGRHPDPARPLEDYSLEELLMDRPDFDKIWEEDTYVVFGHTPTRLLRPDRKDRIFRRGKYIGVDCGCVFGGKLACLCLDTMEERYL